MTLSMTAFARTEQHTEWGVLVWEIRTVNHRYLEPMFRLPEALRSLEGTLRELLRKRLNRGKVDISLRWTATAQQQGVQINQAMAEQILQQASALAQQIPNSAPINVFDLLRWPGVISEPESDSQAINQAAIDAFQQALDQLLETRAREGAELARLIHDRLDQIETITQQLRNHIPELIAAQQQKIRDRLQSLSEELDQNRIEQELVLLAQKADVDEELDRLCAHLTETRRVLSKGEPCGRRLDFLMQEFNREANTLSSKSVGTSATQGAVELKVLIEQMREQIQNIE